MNVTGILRNARRVAPGQDLRAPCLHGQVFGDTKGRFFDGERITTSTIMKEDGDVFQTRFSAYRVESWADGTPTVAAREAANDNAKIFTIGERTHEQVFKAAGITNVSDLQAVLDATERALAPDMATQINDMVAHFHGKSKAAGWWEENGEDLTGNKYVHATKLMLCVSELAEAMEGLRKGLMDDKLPHRKMAEVELADAVIRIFDLAGVLGYDLGGAVVEKSAYNTVRADHQPGNRMLAGGKAY